jgi:hypothetical protein
MHYGSIWYAATVVSAGEEYASWSTLLGVRFLEYASWPTTTTTVITTIMVTSTDLRHTPATPLFSSPTSTILALVSNE